ncbi:MAG: tyrosine recombinase XerC [Armatimonadota bacterium]|jgi:integrase/recombinase XerC
MAVRDIDSFLAYLRSVRRLSDSTLRAYEGDIHLFAEFLAGELGEGGAFKWRAVDYPLIRRYLAHLQQGQYARKSVARKLSSLRAFFRYLEREGKVQSNPAAAAATPKLGRRLPRFLYDDEIKAFLEAPEPDTPFGQRDRAIIETLYASGVRVAELVGLGVFDVDFATHELRVIGKGDKERIALIGQPCVNALRRYIENGRDELLAEARRRGKQTADEALFINRFGGRLTARSVRRLFNKHLLTASLQHDISPHVLRHTFATHLLDRGADLRTVQELLGHASLSSTQIYTHVTLDQLRKEYESGHPLEAKTSEPVGGTEQ